MNILTSLKQTKMKISENFNIEEFNLCEFDDKQLLINCDKLVQNCLQPIRNKFGVVQITSGYRTPLQNLKCGGAKNSQHLTANAADFITPNEELIVVYLWCQQNLKFDQLIYEVKNGKRWIHISYTEGKNRQQCLRKTR